MIYVWSLCGVVYQLIRHWDEYLLSYISPKRSGELWCWYIAEIRFEMRNIFNLISWAFIFFARVLFKCFALVLFDTLVCLIFFVRNLLTIFLTPILFLLCNYTITIDGNFHNVYEIYSSVFRIWCTSFWFLMKHINIILHVSVRGTYLLYLRVEYLHNLLHLNGSCLMCYAYAFIHWI